MTDELVKRLRGWAKDIQQGSTAVWAMDQDLKEAADRIEQLMLARAEALTAERDRLTAIGTEMAESIEGNYYLPGVATRWRAALKGETP